MGYQQGVSMSFLSLFKGTMLNAGKTAQENDTVPSAFSVRETEAGQLAPWHESQPRHSSYGRGPKIPLNLYKFLPTYIVVSGYILISVSSLHFIFLENIPDDGLWKHVILYSFFLHVTARFGFLFGLILNK